MPYFIRVFLLFTLLLSACASVGEADFATSVVTATATSAPSPAAASPAAVEQPTLAPSKTTAPVNATPTPFALPTRVSDLPKPADKTAESTPRPSLLDEYLPGNELLAETEHFLIYGKGGEQFPIDQQWWLEQVEVVYDYVSDRLDGAHVKNKITFAFIEPDKRACPVRGLASYDGTPTVLLFADENSPREYLLAVLAHELGHAIPSEGFPGGLPDELALTEGLATWASGKYWDAWKDVSSIHELVHGYVKSGDYEPISVNYDLHGIYPWQDGTGASCLDRRDRVYGAWGSFLGYLIDTYGREDAYRLFHNQTEERDGKRIEYPPDYEGIYGKSLNQLEAEWLNWLEQK